MTVLESGRQLMQTLYHRAQNTSIKLLQCNDYYFTGPYNSTNRPVSWNHHFVTRHRGAGPQHPGWVRGGAKIYAAMICDHHSPCCLQAKNRLIKGENIDD
jgi:hypothetical protein